MHDVCIETWVRRRISDPEWRDSSLQGPIDHPFMLCSTKLLDPANIWVIIPGPHWWQNRLCFNIAHDTKIEFTDHTVQYRGTSLRWPIYSAAQEAEQNGMSLNFL